MYAAVTVEMLHLLQSIVPVVILFQSSQDMRLEELIV